MEGTPTTRKGVIVRRLLATLGVGLALGLAAIGVYAYRFFTERPGEDTLRLIPSTADVVITVDLNPSVSQATIFKKIDDALERNKVGKELEKGLGSIFESFGAGSEINDLVTRSGAFVVLRTSDAINAEPAFVGFIRVKNPTRAMELIAKCGSTFSLGKWKGVRLDEEPTCFAVIGDYLVISSERRVLHLIARTERDDSPSILSVPEFRACRQQLDGDSNLMVFVNPSSKLFLEEMGENGSKMLDGIGWAGMGLALREDGIAIKYSAKLDAEKNAWLKKLASAKPLRSDLYEILPSGAYCMVAGSQLSATGDLILDIVKDMDPDSARVMDREVRKELGMGVKDGILPALKGNMVIALYPSKAQNIGGDILVMLDDTNEADPAKIVDAVRRALNTSYQNKERKGPLFKANTGDGSEWQLMPKVETELRESMTKGMTSDEFDPTSFIENKTITYVKLGKTVVVSTSEKLLDRAIDSYVDQKDSLITDTRIVPTSRQTAPDAQSMLVIDLTRMAQAVENMLRFDKMEPEGAKVAHQAVDFFKNLKSQVRATSSITATKADGEMFIPMDYDRLVDLVGAFVQGIDKHIEPDIEKTEMPEKPKSVKSTPIRVK